MYCVACDNQIGHNHCRKECLRLFFYCTNAILKQPQPRSFQLIYFNFRKNCFFLSVSLRNCLIALYYVVNLAINGNVKFFVMQTLKKILRMHCRCASNIVFISHTFYPICLNHLRYESSAWIFWNCTFYWHLAISIENWENRLYHQICIQCVQCSDVLLSDIYIFFEWFVIHQNWHLIFFF